MLDNKTFNKKLGGIVASAKSQRDSVQLLIASGVEQYLEHQDTGQLSRLVAACVTVKSLPTTVIKDYIKSRVNVKYVKARDGSMVFKKDGEAPTMLEALDVSWYDWKGNNQHKPKADVDILQKLKNFAASLEKTLVEGKLKAGQEAAFASVMDDLTQLQHKVAKQLQAEPSF